MLGLEYLTGRDDLADVGPGAVVVPVVVEKVLTYGEGDEGRVERATGEICSTCGSADLRRAGACLCCQSCGTSTGCS